MSVTPANAIEPELIEEEETAIENLPVTSAINAATTNEDDVLLKGASFMESLIQTLSDPAGPQRLAGKLTETDEKGKTYLKIPVSNAQVVENALKLFSGLLAGLGKNS